VLVINSRQRGELIVYPCHDVNDVISVPEKRVRRKKLSVKGIFFTPYCNVISKVGKPVEVIPCATNKLLVGKPAVLCKTLSQVTVLLGCTYLGRLNIVAPNIFRIIVVVPSQWRTQKFCSVGGVQQIQLKTEGRENGDGGDQRFRSIYK
jgi:hypothetical protein